MSVILTALKMRETSISGSRMNKGLNEWMCKACHTHYGLHEWMISVVQLCTAVINLKKNNNSKHLSPFEGYNTFNLFALITVKKGTWAQGSNGTDFLLEPPQVAIKDTTGYRTAAQTSSLGPRGCHLAANTALAQSICWLWSLSLNMLIILHVVEFTSSKWLTATRHQTSLQHRCTLSFTLCLCVAMTSVQICLATSTSCLKDVQRGQHRSGHNLSDLFNSTQPLMFNTRNPTNKKKQQVSAFLSLKRNTNNHSKYNFELPITALLL